MKILLRLALLIFFLVPLAHAQSTTASGTITDPNGQAFIDGTYRIEFNANGHTGPFYWNGTPFTPSVYTGGLNGSGAFSGVVVPSSTSISPSGTNWKFTMCPASSSPCYTQGISLSGTSLDVSSIIKPPAIIIQSNAYNQPVAYQDTENLGPTVGYSYFNHTLQHYRVCTDQVPCNWLTICFVGDLTCGGSGFLLETNGTPNGSQSLLNLINGANTTITNTGGITQINAGSGCTLPGNDTGVLSEHPINTCYNSADFTWDDDNTNLQAGDGTNTNTGALQSFIQGVGNDTTNCVTCVALGDSNDITFDVAGTTGLQHDTFSFGVANTLIGSNDGNNKLLGEFGGDNDLEYCQEFYLLGNGNSADGVAHHDYCQIGLIAGDSNAVTSSGGSGALAELQFIFGAQNGITQATGQDTSNSEIFGDNNFITTLNGTGTPEAFIYGFDNAVDGTETIAGNTDVSVYGNSNSATNLVVNFPTYGNANDNVQVGAQETMNNVGLGFQAGMGNNLHDCLNCEVFGYNNDFSTTNALSIGMGGNELVVTPGAVAVNYLGASAPSVCTNSSKQLETSGCPSIIGVQSQTYATLASDSAISSSTPTDIFTVHGSNPTLTMPASGCPCKIAVSYFMYIKQPQNSNTPTDFWVYDGTNVYASSDFRGDGNGMGASQTSQVDYANGVTVTLQLMTEAAQTYTIAKSMAFSPQGSWFEAHVVTSN